MSEELIKFEEVKSDSLSRRVEWIAKREALTARAVAVVAVATDSDLETAGKLQTEITRILKDLEAARMALTRPIDAMKKDIMAQETQLAATLEKELFRLKKLNGDYATKKAAEAEAARKRIQAEARAQAERDQAVIDEQTRKSASLFGPAATFQPAPVQAPAPAPVQPAAPIPQAPKTSANSFPEAWKFEITDQLQVPREFLTVDEGKIRAWIACQKKLGVEIQNLKAAGLRFFKETQVRAK
jgi:hypothetical protein